MAIAELRAFNPSGYEILDDEIARGRVTIWSTAQVTPRRGDCFLIESRGRPYDAVVEKLVVLKGGWSASCRVEGLAL